MLRPIIPLWQAGEYHYPMAQGFIPNLRGYIHEDKETDGRPCMIVVPGGAYTVISTSEGETVALNFYESGYNTFVLTYTTNLLGNAPLHDQPMNDLSRAIRYLRANHKELNLNPNQLVVSGFSAGGHLCASVCVHHQDIYDSKPEYTIISNKPNAAILAYPVITTDNFSHEPSFNALLGKDALEEEKQYHSLEKQVSADVPPCFVWHTAIDETVPVENSFLFIQALKKNEICFAYHVFSEGKHGLSTAQPVTAEILQKGDYTREQTLLVMEALNRGDIRISDKTAKMLAYYEGKGIPSYTPDPDVAIWTTLAKNWLHSFLLNN